MYAYSAVWLWGAESEQISAELPQFCGKPIFDETFQHNNMQIIEFCCEQFNFVLPSRQIANRRDKFIKSDSQRTNLLTFVNM